MRERALLLCLLSFTGVGCQTPAGVGSVHGRLERRSDGLDVLWLWGTREEIGYAEGALLCGRIPRFFSDYYLDFLVPLFGKSYEELSAKLLPRYDVPEDDQRAIRAVLRGMKENCKPEDLRVKDRELRYEDLLFSNLAYELFLACSSFTVWGKASASGATLHARNVDFLLDPKAAYTREQIVKVYSEAEAANARWLALSWPGSQICHSCFTQAGLGFTVNGTNNLPAPPTATGKIPMASAQRRALLATLNTESPQEELVARLAQSPIRAGSNLSVFWPSGAVVLEHDGDASHADGRVTVRRPGEGDTLLATKDAIIATNHYLERVAAPPAENPESIEHYRALARAIDEAAQNGGVDAARARDLLGQVAARAQVLTVVTVIADTATQRVFVYRATEPGKAATDSAPSVLSLPDLFAAFPRAAPPAPNRYKQASR